MTLRVGSCFTFLGITAMLFACSEEKTTNTDAAVVRRDSGSASDAASSRVDSGPVRDGALATDGSIVTADSGEELDGGESMGDAAVANDAGEIVDGATESDAGGEESDAGGEASDGATPMADSGASTSDGGADSRDSGTLAPDSGMAMPDSGMMAPDSGMTMIDSGMAMIDSGMAMPDSGMMAPDSGMTMIDSGMMAMVDSGALAGDAALPIALEGTWITSVATTGTITAPLIGTVDADLDLVARVLVRDSGNDTITYRFEVCRLSSVTTPDPRELVVTYTPAVLAAFTTEVVRPRPTVFVGDPLPLPDFELLAGISATGQSLDEDLNFAPGVTLPVSLLLAGVPFPVDSYVGLNLSISTDLVATSDGVGEGTTMFGVTGQVFGWSLPLPLGEIDVAPTTPTQPLTTRRLDGNVPCSTVLGMF